MTIKDFLMALYKVIEDFFSRVEIKEENNKIDVKPVEPVVEVKPATGTGTTTTQPVVTNPTAGTNTPASATPFEMAYYINPDVKTGQGVTPKQYIDSIDFNALKKQGFNTFYVRATLTGSAGIIYSDMPYVKSVIDKVGCKTVAWVWKGFTEDKAKWLSDKGIGIHIDVETYDMAAEIPALTKLRAVVKSTLEFSVCVKADGWDGGQLYDKIMTTVKPTYLVPMLYIGDYAKSTADLTAFVKKWSAKYPKKFIAALETYKSDKETNVLKTTEQLMMEINAVESYVAGVALFRYGLSNYKVTAVSKPPVDISGWVLTGAYKADYQDTSYTCADSSMLMMLSAKGITNVTEAGLAKLAGTTTGGTGHEGIHTAVSKVAPKIKRSEVLLSEIGGWNGVAKALKAGCEFIVHIWTEHLPNWQGAYGHYVFLTGVNVDTKKVRIFDPVKGDVTYDISVFAIAMNGISQKSLLQFC